jgi:hypothetical protein
MDLREIGVDGVKWVWLTQDRVQWQAFVRTIMGSSGSIKKAGCLTS